jgi:acetyl-CoA carboxylase carboxyltransferase component
MEGDSAVQAVYGPELDKYKSAGQPVPAELEQRIEQTRADYDRWLDSKYAAARGHCDALIDPAETRQILSLAFDAACFKTHTEHVPLQLLSEVKL